MPTQPSESNNRRTRRRQTLSHARILCFLGPCGLGKDLSLGIDDFSESGLSMFCETALKLHQPLVVQLESYHLRRPIKLPAEVVWVRPQENGTYLIGVRFDRTLPYRELHHFTRV